MRCRADYAYSASITIVIFTILRLSLLFYFERERDDGLIYASFHFNTHVEHYQSPLASCRHARLARRLNTIFTRLFSPRHHRITD